MTNGNRFVRKLTEDPRSFACGDVEENIEHIVHLCPTARIVWRKFGMKAEDPDSSLNFQDWLLASLSGTCKVLEDG